MAIEARAQSGEVEPGSPLDCAANLRNQGMIRSSSIGSCPGVHRRGLFAGAAAALVGAFALKRRAAASTPDVKLISAARIGETDSGVVLDSEGLTGFALPARAHALTHLPDGRVLLVGRRPGSFAAIVDPEQPQAPPRIFGPIAGHRFAGHAAVAPSGRTLVTSEIDAETGDGVVVFREGSGAARASVPVGIEPHDLLFAHDGERLVVAVGGIAKAADIKGPAINAGNIESAVVELDGQTGALIRRHQLAPSMASLSLRHMALAPDGETIAMGMQDQDRAQLRPLMAVLRPGRGLELLPLPSDDQGSLRSYIGSVVIDRSGRFIAATSPKGGMVGLWSLRDSRWAGTFALADVCGLAPGEEPASFYATSGLGEIVKLRAGDTGLIPVARWNAPVAFDNHLLRI